MMLVTFATPQENPFSRRLEKGIAAPFEGMLLLLAGVGQRAAERLEHVLTTHSKVQRVVEYGGAAAVHRAEIGCCYTVTRLFDRRGVIHTSLPAVPGLPHAAALCDDAIYRGETFPWCGAAGLPLLYTMETLFLFEACRRRDLPFFSLRLATDDGCGDIRGRYAEVLAAHRAEAAETVRLLAEVSS